MPEAPSISQTILFADIAGSTALYDRLGDGTARSLVAAAIRIMKIAVRANTGQVIKTIGDEVMCGFTSSDAAAKAAIHMQEAVSADQRLTDHTVRLRIGFHHGPVIVEDGDLFGDAVNTAARMTALAKAGQIITSRQTVERLNPKRRKPARLVDQARVKGKADPIDFYEIMWGQPDEMTVAIRDTEGRPYIVAPDGIAMILEWQGGHLRLDASRPAITMGRDRSNQLVIQDSKVSRLHAQLELRKDRIILIDKSTNGTYIHPARGEHFLLYRNEAALEGNGFFSLGSIGGPGAPSVVKYREENKGNVS